MKYENFISQKVEVANESGFEPYPIAEVLKPHQRDIVEFCVRGGCRAIFAQFGLGKTIMQLEIGRQVAQKTGGKFLFVLRLAVRPEFHRDAKTFFGMELEYVRNNEEVRASSGQFLITNYERVRDGQIDVTAFQGVSLDEASILRSYGSKTYQTFLDIFKPVPYRFVATATPSPNRFKELIHYAGYLGIMDTGQALTRFFQRDSQKASNLTLMPHREADFWQWVGSWAVFCSDPSDLGYPSQGYKLPELNVIEHRLAVDHSEAGTDSWGHYKLFKDLAVSLQDAAKEKRNSMLSRLQRTIEIIKAGHNSDHWIIWHHLEDERKLIEGAELPGLKSVYGSLRTQGGNEELENRLIAFSEGKFRILSTKPQIAGSGCNFQKHCHKAIFFGINDKFNDFIQAIHRIYRFGQTMPVEIHIIYTESEDKIFERLQTKWRKHDKFQMKMKKIVKEHGLAHRKTGLKRSMGVERLEHVGKNYVAVRNDCVLELETMEANSVDLIHTSIPFSNHYEYSPTYECFGHNINDDSFFQQMDYLTAQLLRVLKPGRIAAIHVKNRIMFGNVTGLGFPTLNPFSHKTVFHYMRHGFQFLGEIVVLTDVVRENNQTYRLGWSENAKDSSKMGVGCPEYVLIFRKPQSDTSRGYADIPVTKDKEQYSRSRWQVDANAFWRSRGDRFLTGEDLVAYDMEKISDLWRDYNSTHVYDYEGHYLIGEALDRVGRLPATFMLFPPQSWRDDIWDDVTRMRTLNSDQSAKAKVNHICPLQFDIVDRIIDRYSNPGELVLDPFAGLFTVPYRALLRGRKGKGIELNAEYFHDGLQYMRAAEIKRNIPTLFDVEKL